MTCCTSFEPYMASDSSGRTPAAALRGISRLAGLRAVLRAGLLAVAHAGGVERAADDLVAHARQVLDAAAAHEHDRVLLQVVAFPGDVGGDLHAVRQAHARDLAQRGVGLLRRGRVDAGADATALRGGDAPLAALAGLEAGRGELFLRLVTALPDELVDAWHAARDGSNGGAPCRGAGRPRPRSGGPRAAGPAGCGGAYWVAAAARSGAGVSAAAMITSTKAQPWTAMPTGSLGIGSPNTRIPPLMADTLAAALVSVITGTASPTCRPRAEL